MQTIKLDILGRSDKHGSGLSPSWEIFTTSRSWWRPNSLWNCESKLKIRLKDHPLLTLITRHWCHPYKLNCSWKITFKLFFPENNSLKMTYIKLFACASFNMQGIIHVQISCTSSLCNLTSLFPCRTKESHPRSLWTNST